jgi:hypothetical protein
MAVVAAESAAETVAVKGFECHDEHCRATWMRESMCCPSVFPLSANNWCWQKGA